MAAEHVVKFSENAFLEMLLAGVEAYEGARLDSGEAVETIGHLWGYRGSRGEGFYHTVEHVSVSALADRSAGAVSPHSEALVLKRGLCEWLRPELTFLGDFHTHPYTSLAEASAAKGWQYSPDDESSLLLDDSFWDGGPHPLMVVLAISPLQRVHWTEPTRQKSNVYRFDVFDHRFWLSVAVGNEQNGQRSVQGNTRNSVYLAPPPFDVSNWSQERLSKID